MQSSPWSLFRSKGDAREPDLPAHAQAASLAPAPPSTNTPADPTLSFRKSSRRLSSFLSPSRQLRKSASASPSRSSHSADHPPLPSPTSSAAGINNNNTQDTVATPLLAPQHADTTAMSPMLANNAFSSSPAARPIHQHPELDERELNRHLADMESSFVPSPLAPRYAAATTSQPGAQPSNKQSPKRSRPRAVDATPSTPAINTTVSDSTAGRLSAEAARTPIAASSPTKVLSSPSAAAAQRNRLRAGQNESPVRNTVDTSASSDSIGAGPPTIPTTTVEPPSQDIPIPSVEIAAPPAAPQNGSSLHPEPPSDELRPQNRPDYLRSHQASQRSSASSFITHDSGLDTPRSRATLRPDLQRVPSLGSVASSFSDFADSVTSRRRRTITANARQAALDRLSEEPRSSVPPETPRNIDQSQGPTDTVLAKHVRDVEVPNTVAREYRAAQAPDSGRQSLLSAPGFGRGKGELTLKEQNSRIDKLSKENFDLKLKIHYLYQALQDRSDEGVKDLIAKNAQLQADLVKSKKEIQTLRKRLRMQDQQSQRRDGLAVSVSAPEESETESSSQAFKTAQMEDEIQYLRTRVQALEHRNEGLQQDGVNREFEKRRLAERVRLVETQAGTEAADEAWQELLEIEIARREQAEQSMMALQAEVDRLRNDRSPGSDLHLRPGSNHLRSITGEDGVRLNTSLSGSTVADQLRQENADLRRDLSAQTSMLTSRNRERERLQQEIEDLKLVQRRNEGPRSLAGDSIFDRSVSRNNQRPSSRQSAATRLSQLSDHDREHYETIQATLRDENSALKLRNQDLQQELDEVASGSEHIRTLRIERDEAVRLMREDADWAEQEIQDRDKEIDRCREEIEHLLADLDNQEAESRALQQEVKEIRESLNRVANDSDDHHGTIQNLREELITTTGEIEALEKNLRDANAAKERLEVQAESSQGEIAFLREEQETDKIKISDLQSALRSAKNSLRDEKERLRELEELENEARQHRDEARKLRKDLLLREEEALSYKDGLDEVESRLREIFGSNDAGRSTLVRNVVKLQQNLEFAVRDLEQARADIDERDRVLGDRNNLLDSSGAETRRLAELLDRERKSRKYEQAMFDQANKARAGAPNNGQVAALEERYQNQLREKNTLLLEAWLRLSSVCGDKWVRKHGYDKQQLTVDTLMQDPAMINIPLAHAMKAVEQLNKAYMSRIRDTERHISARLQELDQAVEQRTERIARLEQTGVGEAVPADMVRYEDYKAVKSENRSLRKELKILKQGAFALPGLPSPVEDLERAAAAAAVEERRRTRDRGFGFPGLDAEHSTDRNASALTRRAVLSDEEYAAQVEANKIDPKAMRQAAAKLEGHGLGINGDGEYPETANMAPSDQRWILRLKELERMLKQERESRVMDRHGARKRLQQGMVEKEELRRELERERNRTGESARSRSDEKAGEAIAE